ncbi:DUF771 domain-containing protein [Listeria ilorinensis]|uniref:DUF771 domain-containing protein n=1 Tax=Listeria ilorinensis TaxID=2867439 RepID=UPI001EF70FAB|nr:DUF771 domain-containing protein [Listeria ilorinensis]
MTFIKVDNEAARNELKAIIREIMEEEGIAGSLWKMERMQQECGGRSKQWIVEHVCNHPYVIRNELAFISGKEWTFKAKKMQQFLNDYFPELKTNWKKAAREG